MLNKFRPLILLLVAALAISGCTPSVPQQPYIPVETIVAATYAAISAQTEAARPPDTPTPFPATATRRPSTPTPTPTVTYVLPSITPTFTPSITPEPEPTNVTSGSGTVLYSCKILSLSPENVFRVKANESFSWVWRVKNVGTTRWDADDVEAFFSGGEQFSKSRRFNISQGVKPDSTTTVEIEMKAPSAAGAYTTTWSLRKGIHYFCYAQLEIEVYK